MYPRTAELYCEHCDEKTEHVLWEVVESKLRGRYAIYICIRCGQAQDVEKLPEGGGRV